MIPNATAPAPRAAPKEIKRVNAGVCSVTLKHWLDGSHSVELGQKDHKTGEWSNITIPVHAAVAVSSALSAMSSLGIRREAEQDAS